MTPLAMILYPFAAALVFRVLPFVLAIPSALLVGFLLLPAGVHYDVPLLPSLTKTSTPVFVTLLMIFLFMPRPSPYAQRSASAPKDELLVLPGWIPRARWVQALIALFVIAPMMTALLNGDWLTYGPTTLRALTLYDGANMVQLALVAVLPFLIGRRFLAGEDGHRALLLALLTAGLLYSLPTLAEVRLSPQLHNIVYGYFPHSWLQHVRGDGFRPVVFLNHGLVLSMFLCTAALAIAAYMRAIDGEQRILYFLGAAYMTVVVFLSKSLGMTLVACVLIPVILFCSVRVQMVVAGGVAALVFAYPFMRTVGINPLMAVVGFVEGFAPERAASLAFRLNMEDRLIDRMLERPLFGWGSLGRSELWSATGFNTAVRDGLWIIQIGERGVFGFVSQFGLLCLPIMMLALKAKPYALSAATAGLCLVLAANALDLVPNAGITPYTFLVAGALAGRLELGAAQAPEAHAALARSDGAPGPQAAAARGPAPADASVRDGQVYARVTADKVRSPARKPGSGSGPRPATGRIGPPHAAPAPAKSATPRQKPPGDSASETNYSRYPIRPSRKPGRA